MEGASTSRCVSCATTMGNLVVVGGDSGSGRLASNLCFGGEEDWVGRIQGGASQTQRLRSEREGRSTPLHRWLRPHATSVVEGVVGSCRPETS
jgi:hypothetical protein